MAAPLIAAAAIGAAANIYGGMQAQKAQKQAAQEAAAIQQANIAAMTSKLEAIGLPSIVAQQLVLKDPQYAGDLIAQQLGPSALEQVAPDAALRKDRMSAIRSLQERVDTGLTPSELAQYQQMADQTGMAAKSRDAAIMSQMAQSGTMDSGAALAQRLMANQGATQRQAEQGRVLGGQAADRRFAAIQALGEQSGNLENTDFSRASNLASQRDAIARANAANLQSTQQFNLGRKDVLAAQAAENRKEEERKRSQLVNQEYLNKMGRFATEADLMSGSANVGANLATTLGAGKAALASGIGSAIGGAATSIGGAMNKPA